VKDFDIFDSVFNKKNNASRSVTNFAFISHLGHFGERSLFAHKISEPKRSAQGDK